MNFYISKSAFSRSLLLFAALSVGACASIPETGSKSVSVVQPTELASSESFAAEMTEWPQDDWWQVYGDPQLSALIEEGLSASPSLQIAAARVRSAQSYVREAVGSDWPDVDFNADAGFTKQSYNMGFPKAFVPKGWKDRGAASFSASYDFDFWGKSQAELAAATSDYVATLVDERAARMALATQITSAYVDLASRYTERDLRTDALNIRQSSLDLVQKRVDNGLATRGDLKLAEANLATARAELATNEEALSKVQNQLAVLVGAGPDRGLSIERPALAKIHPRGVPIDATTNLVARRPDIEAARLRAEASAERIKMARADFYPSVRVQALVGIQALGLNNLISTDSLYGSAGPAISLPIFHAQDLESRYDRADAGYAEAVANYNAAVLAAYQDVADAVTSRSYLDERVSQTKAALDASEEAYDIAMMRYEGGLSNYLDVLTVEERLLNARAAMAELYSLALKIDLALVNALGGGFDANPDQTTLDLALAMEMSDG